MNVRLFYYSKENDKLDEFTYQALRKKTARRSINHLLITTPINIYVFGSCLEEVELKVNQNFCNVPTLCSYRQSTTIVKIPEEKPG